MSDKKYYAVKIGRNPGIYETWDECSKEVIKFPHAVYKSFKDKASAEAFIHGENSGTRDNKQPSKQRQASSFQGYFFDKSRSSDKLKYSKKDGIGKFYTYNGIGSYFSDYSDALKLKNERFPKAEGYPVCLPNKEEAEALSEGKFSEYIKQHLNVPSFDGADAICFSDGSYSDDFNFSKGLEEDFKCKGKAGELDRTSGKAASLKRYTASFGLLILSKSNIPIFESGFLVSISDTETKRIIFDEKGEKKLEDKIVTLESEEGYVRSGMAETAECEGAFRVLEICREKGFKKIKLIVDAENVINALRFFDTKKEAESLCISRLSKFQAEFPIMILNKKTDKVRSHTTYAVSDILFFYSAMNDLCDIASKAELPAKSGANIRKDNPNLLRLVPEKDGEFTCNPEKVGLSLTIKNLPRDERRQAVRQILRQIQNSTIINDKPKKI